MNCKTCDILLAVYKRSVHVFVTTVLTFLTFRQAEGDDSTMSVEEVDRLQLERKDAHDALVTHRERMHGESRR